MIQKLNAAKSLSGTVHLPGDKSISHRYAMLAAIAEGTTVIQHFAASQDCHSTLKCLAALGVEIQEAEDTVTIKGRGLNGLRAPDRMLDAENSGTTIRLLSGILAGHDFACAITGDASLSNRPMGRIMQPLRLMGAAIESREKDLPPLKIRGGSLKGIRYSLPVASAQVKSCVLLAGLYGAGITAVEETIPTRDHTEIALKEFGGSVRIIGNWIEVDPAPRLQARQLVVPGDLSGAAFFLVAASLVPDSDLRLPSVSLNERRRELLSYLERAGMDLCVENESRDAGEARGDLRVRYNPDFLKGRLPAIQGAEVAALIDEIPVLAVLGSQVAGGLEISDAQELRIKESDRIAAIAANLRSMGAEVTEKPDGLIIPGGQKLKGTDIATRKDHRIAMAFAVAGLTAQGETRIHDAECANVSFPDFWSVLQDISDFGNPVLCR
jgi:3-phosphoshikimate 1-carboxyvinyltransferase